MMFKRDKNGVIVSTFLIKMIIAVMSFMLIIGGTARFISKVGDKDAEAICRISVDARSSSTISVSGVEGIKYIPLECKTMTKKLSGTIPEVQKQMADLMTKCWWMFRLGKTAELFDKVPGFSGINKGIVCYNALIDDIKDPSGKEYFTGNEMMNFMKTTNHPDLGGKTATGAKSYLDYIQYHGGPGKALMLLTDGTKGGTESVAGLIAGKNINDNGGVFREGYGYEIVYVEKKGSTNAWFSSLLLGGGYAVALGGATALAIGTGGLSLVVYGGLAVGAGILAVKEGATIKIDDMMSQNDVSTIMVVDMSNDQLRKELHSKHIISDIAGE